MTYTREARGKRRILLDPTFHLCCRKLYNAINAFFVARAIDIIVSADIVVEVKAVGNNETQDGSTSGAIFFFEDDASYGDALLDKEVS